MLEGSKKTGQASKREASTIWKKERKVGERREGGIIESNGKWSRKIQQKQKSEKKNENPKNPKSTYQEPEQGDSRQPKGADQKHDLFIGLVVDQVLG